MRERAKDVRGRKGKSREHRFELVLGQGRANASCRKEASESKVERRDIVVHMRHVEREMENVQVSSRNDGVFPHGLAITIGVGEQGLHDVEEERAVRVVDRGDVP